MKHTFLAAVALCVAASLSSCNNSTPSSTAVDLSGKADKLVTGNIITMDGHKMRAQAMTIKNGMVQYVGSKKVAESLCDENTVREDYGSNTVYPGFIDVHVHPLTAGQRRLEAINLVPGETIDDYIELVRQFVESHPDNTSYKGAGWSPRDREMTAKDLDAVCADKPIILNSIDGHSYWLNTKALQQFEFTREVAQQDGPAQVHVDADGNPSGVVVEENERMAAHTKADLNEEKEAIMLWQDFAFTLGLTTVGDAGFGSVVDLEAYKQLDAEGKLKLLTYSSFYDPIPGQPVEEKIANAVNARAQYTTDHFKVTGIKMFADGVVEGHTAWLNEEYLDQPGYFGVKKIDDHDYLTAIVKSANENGLYVHVHAIGDGAVKFVVDAMEDAQQQTGIYDARNCIAHLQLVRPEDVTRMADNNIIAIVAPLWTPYDDTVSPMEAVFIGEERCTNAYPIRSFLDKGAVIAFHTDYPVSTAASIPGSVATAVERCGDNRIARRVAEEGITRLEALQAMTVNAAYALGDSTIGTLATGNKANYAVFDADFLSDPLDKVRASAIVATAVEGEVVYSTR